MPKKKGLILINLGTPDFATTSSVRSYLREFLIDPRVIDLPFIMRVLLLYVFILPFRPQRSAQAYKSIWTNDGSPLLINSIKLKNKLQAHLGAEQQVSLAMRYGKPSIEDALQELADCTHLTILPLYPQYSSAATGSSLEKTLVNIAKNNVIPSLKILRDFYDFPGFITAMAKLIAPYRDGYDYLLFSYHGLPERQLEKNGCLPVCRIICPPITLNNNACYRAQCQQTTELIARELGLAKKDYGYAFQSRLGKTPWIKPYTDNQLPELINKNIRRLAVVCPSFTVDCLETLEEIGIRAREQWEKLGGETLTLVPCLNDDENWVKALAELATSRIEKY